RLPAGPLVEATGAGLVQPCGPVRRPGEACPVTLASLGANLGGVVLFAAPGYGLTALCAPLRRLGWMVRRGSGFSLGTLAVAGSLFAASHLFGVPLRRPAIFVAVLAPCALGLAAWLMRRLRRLPTPAPARVRRVAAPGDRRRWWLRVAA